MRDYDYEKFGIMFLSPDLTVTEKKRVASKVRKFDRKIETFIDKQSDLFYKELEKIGYYNNMGVIQEIPKGKL